MENGEKWPTRSQMCSPAPSLSLSLSFILIFSLSFSYTELSMIFHMFITPIYLKFYEIREIVKHKKHIDSYA